MRRWPRRKKPHSASQTRTIAFAISVAIHAAVLVPLAGWALRESPRIDLGESTRGSIEPTPGDEPLEAPSLLTVPSPQSSAVESRPSVLSPAAPIEDAFNDVTIIPFRRSSGDMEWQPAPALATPIKYPIPTPESSAAIEPPAALTPLPSELSHTAAGGDEDSAYLSPTPDATNHPPAYPKEFRGKRIRATVVLEIRIAADGHVVDVQVVRSSNRPAFDDAAVAAIQTWHYHMPTGLPRDEVLRVTQKIDFRPD